METLLEEIEPKLLGLPVISSFIRA